MGCVVGLYTPRKYRVVLWNYDGQFQDVADELDLGEVGMGFRTMSLWSGSPRLLRVLSPRGIVGWAYFDGMRKVA